MRFKATPHFDWSSSDDIAAMMKSQTDQREKNKAPVSSLSSSALLHHWFTHLNRDEEHEHELKFFSEDVFFSVRLTLLDIKKKQTKKKQLSTAFNYEAQ